MGAYYTLGVGHVFKGARWSQVLCSVELAGQLAYQCPPQTREPKVLDSFTWDSLAYHFIPQGYRKMQMKIHPDIFPWIKKKKFDILRYKELKTLLEGLALSQILEHVPDVKTCLLTQRKMKVDVCEHLPALSPLASA